MAELLFWPALLGYSQAAVALFGEARRPGLAGRLGIWGVRFGWLAQTALLGVQAARADGFPWSSWAGALNLFAWLVVGAYLFWGCRPRFRLLGLWVMPVAAALLVAAYAGGGIGNEGDNPSVVLALHVALMLVAFAGFTLAAGLSGLYVWHERRLKRREATILRLRVPPLEALDALAARTVAISLAVLGTGVTFGLVSLVVDGGELDAVMVATLVASGVYAGLLVLRHRAALHGRRSAYLVLAGFALVVATFSITHFAA